MSQYLQDQNVIGLFRNTITIYFRHILVLFTIHLLPTIPLSYLSWASFAADVGSESHGEVPLLAFLSLVDFLQVIITYFVIAATTVALSDVYLGNPPEVLRSFRRLKGVIWSLLWTYILTLFVVSIGWLFAVTTLVLDNELLTSVMVLVAIVFTLVAIIYLGFVSPIVVLERRSGVAALKRSFFLVRGNFWRVSVVGGCMGVIYVASLLLVAAAVMVVIVFSEQSWILVVTLLLAVPAFGILQPLLVVATVVLYYDLRVRREYFDHGGLLSDLRS